MTIIIKPTFSCNFRCSYCYLSNSVKMDSYMMSVKSVKKLVDELIDMSASSQRKGVTFIWHGGEPLLWGIDNYRQIFDYTQQYRERLSIKHSVQTNLSLINKEYIELFKTHNVHVGFSLDGPKSINDCYRKRADGQGTFDDIIFKLNMCKKAGLNVGAIIVASSAFKNRIHELYNFLCEYELNFKFNPLFLSGEASNMKGLSLTPNEYAIMTKELFDLWFFDKKHHIKESTFIDIASAFLSSNKRTTGCMFSANCQNDFIAISPQGDVFPCGRFCDTDTTYSYGNINLEGLDLILSRQKASAQYKRGAFVAMSSCKDCSFFKICHGGCLHDGFINSGNFESKTFLCTAYKLIFSHIQKRVEDVLGVE